MLSFLFCRDILNRNHTEEYLKSAGLTVIAERITSPHRNVRARGVMYHF